jgi:uncharacterized membrane protein
MTLEQLRNLSIVILAVESFFLCLVLAVVLFFAIHGTSQAIAKLRIYGPKARGAFRRMAASAEQTSQKISAPFVAASTTRARVERTVSAAFSIFGHRKGV